MEQGINSRSNNAFSGQRQNREGASRTYIAVIPRSAEERLRQRETEQRDVWKNIAAKTKAKGLTTLQPRPIAYERPAFNTPQYWRDCARGWITDHEQREDQANYESRRKRAVDSKYNKAAPPHRHERVAPLPTKQFAKPMSTQAARDDRLTPQSKALLQVIAARTGEGRYTDTTKTTLGIIMNRCPRSIQRYLQELIKFGYLRTQTRKSRRSGFFIGLRIWIMNSVLPFYAQHNEDYDPEKWLDMLGSRSRPEETIESLTNNKIIILNVLKREKPPWFAEFAF